MKCPVCKDPTLVMTERQGIEIDYCPQCRGVWLDRGELDKMIEQAAAPDVPETQPAPQPQRPAAPQQPYPYPPPPPHPGYSREYDPYYRRKKKWWKDVFDFD